MATMDAKTSAAFIRHVKVLERQAIDGHRQALKTLACMALLVEGWRPVDPSGGGEIIDLTPYLEEAAREVAQAKIWLGLREAA